MKRLTPAFALLLLAACSSAPAADDASGGQASTVGSRATSPLANGRYDSTDGTLHIYSWLTQQEATLSILDAQGVTHTCGSSSVDVTNGEAKLKTDDCDVDMTQVGRDILVSGTLAGEKVGAIYARRDNASLKGSYLPVTNFDKNLLAITAADDDNITFDLTIRGTQIAKGAVATSKANLIGNDSIPFTSANCETSLEVRRDRGYFSISVAGRCGNDNFTEVFVPPALAKTLSTYN